MEGATSPRRLCACSHRCCWGCKTKKMVLKLLRHARQARSQPQFRRRPYIRGGCRRRRGLSSLDSWPAIFVVAWDAARRSSAVGVFCRRVASCRAAPHTVHHDDAAPPLLRLVWGRALKLLLLRQPQLAASLNQAPIRNCHVQCSALPVDRLQLSRGCLHVVFYV